MLSRASSSSHATLLRRGLRLEYATLAWNVVGAGVLALVALASGSPALGGFGLDSLIEIGASIVVVWQLRGAGRSREQRALRLIGSSFALLTVYVVVQVTYTVLSGGRPGPSAAGMAWTATTAGVMLGLAMAKTRTGRALDNPVLTAEGRVTLIDALLATAVLVGVTLNTTLGWWWADPAAGVIIALYAAREARHAMTSVS